MTEVMREKLYNDEFELTKHSLGEIEKTTEASKLKIKEENRLLIFAVQQAVLGELEKEISTYQDLKTSTSPNDDDLNNLKIAMTLNNDLTQKAINRSKRILTLPESVYEVYVETGKYLTSTDKEPIRYADRRDHEMMERELHRSYDKKLEQYAKLSPHNEEEPLTTLDTVAIKKAVEDVLTTSKAKEEKVTLGEATSHIMENYLKEKEKTAHDVVSFEEVEKQDNLIEEELVGPQMMRKDIQPKEKKEENIFPSLQKSNDEKEKTSELTFETDESSFEIQIPPALKTIDELESYLQSKKEEFARCQRTLGEAKRTYQTAIAEMENAKEAALKAKKTAEETERLVDEASEKLVLYQTIATLEANTKEVIAETNDLKGNSDQAQQETEKYLEDNKIYSEQISNNKQKLQNLSLRLETFQQPQPKASLEVIHQVDLPDETPARTLRR